MADKNLEFRRQDSEVLGALPPISAFPAMSAV